MVMCGSLYLSSTLQALIIFAALAILVGDVQGRHHGHVCPPPFSCGHLQNISHPFRRRGDPRGCGVQSYELACTDGKATIQINTGTYFVTEINYTGSYFWVVDAYLDTNSSCPLPRSDQLPYLDGIRGSHDSWELEAHFEARWASFVNCSHAVRNNSMYRPVACLSTNNSFVYVLHPSPEQTYEAQQFFRLIESLEPSCGYLAMIPLGGPGTMASGVAYADIVKSMRVGFAVRFPLTYHWDSWTERIDKCLKGSIHNLKGSIRGSSTTRSLSITIGHRHMVIVKVSGSSTGIKSRTILLIDNDFWSCMAIGEYFPSIPLWFVKWIAVLCRFVLAPLAVLIFLAHKYWKTRITIDAVEKFLRMQQMLGPMRYAYTDITAITRHFRDKLGQGGYGSVYKGVLLPGDVHVAVKMLSNSNCNGEEFISEVSTIGRIHHVNVVRLVGFCSEEIRRALVYEYMPRGSLDKYIFSTERTFSWDKLNEIALGIARGINYLHQGCDMRIIHFDIKPHNILLDNNFIPKVADFGLAKLYPRDKSFVPASALRGTVGYIAPEMISRSFGVISSKSDVYSFGMLLLEMAGGRRNADHNAANSSQAYYPSWVYARLTEQQEVGEISTAADMHELERKLCIVGLRCIQMKSHDRPTMSEVIEMLEGGIDVLQVPSRPFFCDDDEHIPTVESCHFSSELTAITEEDD